MDSTQLKTKQIIDAFNYLVESQGSKVKLVPSDTYKPENRDCYKVSLNDKFLEVSLTDDYVDTLMGFLKEYDMKAQIENLPSGVFVLPFPIQDCPEGVEKITYAELCRAMRAFNEAIDKENEELRSKGEKPISRSDRYLKGVIVIKEESFNKLYPLDSRSYVVNNDNKAWISGMGGYSIYGSSLDKSDPCVRLEQYLKYEHGGKDGWEVDYCYIINE